MTPPHPTPSAPPATPPASASDPVASVVLRDELVIEAGHTEAHYWRDLWRYRDLFAFLAWRDLLVRYKQTVFGVLWAVLRPLLTMLIFVVIFSRVAGLPSGGVPYAILVLGGMLPWQFFASALSESSNSLVSNANLLTKIYFPRIILPTSAVIVALVDFAITLVLLGLVMAWYAYLPPPRILLLPLFVVLALLAALGPGLIATALNVRYRDFRFVIPFVVQFGLYLSPVGFRSEVIEEKLGPAARLLFSLNPMVGVIDGFRWCIGAEPELHVGSLVLSLVTSLVLLWVGVRYFRSTEKGFADVI
jgi:lipopolysaccharide transport system permease protein